MKMHKLTAIIPTGNEEDNIEGVLESVSFADEIMVVDSFSTDRTVELAGKYTDRILRHEYVNSAAQKNWAIPQASHEWILLVDADERVTPELKEEIRSLLSGTPHKAAYWIYRKNYFMGRRVRFSGWQGDKVIRLFQRDRCRYEEKKVHAEIITEDPVGELKNKLIHNTYKGVSYLVNKTDRYTTWGALDRAPKYRNAGFYLLFFRPAFQFFRNYILKLGILDGKVGFVLCAHSAWSTFLRSVKIWRLKEGEKIDS